MRAKRYNILLLIAGIAGLLLALAVSSGYSILQAKDKLLQSREQPNLTNASGIAGGFIARYPVSITVQDTSGGAAEDTYLSLDGYRWYHPGGGLFKAQLREGNHSIQVARLNRVAKETIEVVAGENTCQLDMALAPFAPELLHLSIKYGESGTFALDLQGAESVDGSDAPNGVSVVASEEGHFLQLDGSLLPPGIQNFSLVAANPNGKASTFVSLEIMRDQEAQPISDVAGLDAVRDDLSGSYYLAGDIDLNGIAWQAIGTRENPFRGVLDGKGHRITGYQSVGEGGPVALFAVSENASFQNILIEAPMIHGITNGKTIAYASLCVELLNSKVENCAVLGGQIRVEGSGEIGGLCYNASRSILLGCFNSADISTDAYGFSNIGGIAGGINGYAQYCANQGDMRGFHLTAGIAGFQPVSTAHQTYSIGKIVGNPLVGEFLPGGIAQTTEYGRISHSYYDQAMSSGTRAFQESVVIGVVGLPREAFRDREQLPLLGSFEGSAPDWAYASMDAWGPVPYHIFQTQTMTPICNKEGNKVVVAAKEGVWYFFAVNGDPYTKCLQGVESFTVVLKPGDRLQVFAASYGKRDSEIIAVAGDSQ